MRQFLLQNLLRTAAHQAGFRIATPLQVLQQYPQTQEVVLIENTAWSCAHGIARWSTGCSCTPGDQQWKPCLRTAIDRLAGGVDALYQNECHGRIDYPWRLRNSYINVVLGHMDGPALLQQFAAQAIPTATTVRLLYLLEAERYCQAMYTSCGWYFEDLNRIETRNNIAYAAMAIELVRRATGIDLAQSFRNSLAAAKSWLTDENGRDFYDRIVAKRQV